MAKQSLKQVAFQTIKQKILSCEYEPNSFLNEDLLCQELQMSRTPVRDALGRLEQEHLVIIMPKKGFYIAPLTLNEINMVIEGRMMLEPYIVKNYCQHLSDETLEALLLTIRKERESIKNQGPDVFELDDQFHQIIVSQCTNHYFLDLYEKLSSQNRRISVLSGRTSDDRLKYTLEEHIDIYTELSKNNYKKASESMLKHIQNAKVSAHQFFRKQNPI